MIPKTRFNEYYFALTYSINDGVTYQKKGVNIHKPVLTETKNFYKVELNYVEWEDPDKIDENPERYEAIRNASLPIASFVSCETGRTTDEFYGVKNDFQLSFLAAAAKGARFDVMIHDEDDSRSVSPAYYIGTYCGTFHQKPDGTWEPLSAEPVIDRKLYSGLGRYTLKNQAYQNALKTHKVPGNIHEIIDKSIEMNFIVA